MISEGSCDTEEWSNDAENSAFHHRNKLHFKIYSNIYNITVLLYFDQINLAFFSRTLFQKLFQTWHVSQIIIYTYLQQKQ